MTQDPFSKELQNSSSSKATSHPSWRSLVWLPLAAANTPILVFVSTSTGLFARNITDFLFDQSVLYPLWKYAAFTWLIGMVILFGNVLLARFRQWVLPIRWIGWCYLLTGPFLLTYSQFHHAHSEFLDRPVTLISISAGWLILSGLLAWKKRPSAFSFEFALAFLLFLAIEVRVYSNEIRLPFSPNKGGSNDISQTSDKPNVYHFMLDTYQSDVFQKILDDKLRERLKGFHGYSNCTGPYSCTNMAVSSVMLGQYYNPHSPQIEFFWRAFESEESLLRILKGGGYYTRAFLWTGFNKIVQRFPFFDKVEWIFAKSPGGSLHSSDNKIGFLSFWAYSNFPRAVALRIGDPSVVLSFDRTLKSSSSDADAKPDSELTINSGGIRGIVQGFIDNRQALTDVPSKGVYTFAHTWGIHWDKEFMHQKADGMIGDTTTTLEENARGSLAQVLNVVDDLKRKKQFQDAMIVVHADHGRWSRGGSDRFRTLLLVKFPGENDTEVFREHSVPVSLLDIAPTILESVNLSPSPSKIGYSLTRPDLIPDDRLRLSFNGFSGVQIVSKIQEWRIEANQSAAFIQDIPLDNNPADWTPQKDGITPADTEEISMLKEISEVQTPLEWYKIRTHYEITGRRDTELLNRINRRGDELCQQAPMRASLLRGVELVDFRWDKIPGENSTFRGTFLLRITEQPDFSPYREISFAFYFNMLEEYKSQWLQANLKPSGLGYTIRNVPAQTWKKGEYVLLSRSCKTPDIPCRLQAALGGDGKIIGTKINLGSILEQVGK